MYAVLQLDPLDQTISAHDLRVLELGTTRATRFPRSLCVVAQRPYEMRPSLECKQS